ADTLFLAPRGGEHHSPLIIYIQGKPVHTHHYVTGRGPCGFVDFRFPGAVSYPKPEGALT
ncbi:MAG TPA: hypothetical protein VLJ39_03790, partial [Tepidisphaeraceae bacterium]|nr:hypothetical protein [Tepidisphaeraceae bacterium]